MIAHYGDGLRAQTRLGNQQCNMRAEFQIIPNAYLRVLYCV